MQTKGFVRSEIKGTHTGLRSGSDALCRQEIKPSQWDDKSDYFDAHC